MFFLRGLFVSLLTFLPYTQATSYTGPSLSLSPVSKRLQLGIMTEAITALGHTFPKAQLVVRNTTEFDELNASYLSALESDITPACIFLPKTKAEVQAFVQTVRPFAASGLLKFAIRGAGQVPLPGSANIENGITLDLRNLTGVECKDGIVSIAAGERWSRVYEKLAAEGLGVTGSRSGNGGIGGLALEGGLSFFSSREGFVSDNVVNYEVVLASGEIVNANAHENSDLWTALRGGSNNFGIVTRFDMKTFKQGPFWGGSVFYFPASFPSQIEALVDEIKKPNASEETQLMVSIGYAAAFGMIACQNQVYYTKEATTTPPVLEPFTAIQPQIDALNSLRVLNLTSAASEQAADGQTSQRVSYMNTVIKADNATLQEASTIYTTALSNITSIAGLIGSLTLQPYPVSLLRKSVEHGGNSLGLSPSDGPLVSVLLLTTWQNKSDDEIIFNTMRGVLENIKKVAVAKNTAVDYVFMNYAAAFQDPISSYGAESKRKLQHVSKKYDPEGVFQKGVPGGFKLFV
ncbi:oxidoreductase FAD-binding protein [Rutstroemia sp. NJR-2017a BVV2]|nr:oxidoreductase FAD-binding protein [Rutstroemia sp. NJR-2017a BVV2]